MKKILIILVLLLCTNVITAQNDNSYESGIDEIAAQNSVLGLSLAFFKDGEIIGTYNYGYTDNTRNVNTDDDTVYRIASTSKMISNMLIMKLVEEGKINISDSVYLSTGLEYDEDVKLWHILTHTSGYGDSELFNNNFDKVYDINEMIKLSNRNIKPGTSYEYSNFVAGTMSAIVERLTGMRFYEYANEVLFDEYNLNASYLVEDLEEGTTVAKMYMGEEFDPNTWMFNKEFYDLFPLGDQYRLSYGSLYISATDLAKLGIILCDGEYDGKQFFKESTLELIRYPRFETAYYTMALNTDIFKGNMVKDRTIYGHNGHAYNAITSLIYDPEDHTGVAIITNYSTADKTAGIYNVVRDIAQLTYDTFFEE